MKYRHTPYLSISPSKSIDSYNTIPFQYFLGKNVVITEKMDGENTTITKNKIHARSPDGTSKEWQSYVRQKASLFQYYLEDEESIIGENMFAVHSLEYSNLEDYFLAFAYKKNGVFKSFDALEIICKKYDIKTVPVLYKGVFTLSVLEWIRHKKIDTTKQEGFVIRVNQDFNEETYYKNIAKWVRPNHVQTDEHWSKLWVKNKQINLLKHDNSRVSTT